MLSPGRLRRLSPGGRASGRRISPGRQGVESPRRTGAQGPDPGTAQEESRWAWDIHKVILVRRSNDKFGFYIRGGKEHGFGIFVSALDKPGNAERQGLRIGDRILRVNDVDFREITHQEAVRTIQSATRLVVYVTSYMSHKMPEKEKISEIERAKEEEARLEKEKAARKKKEEEEGVAKLFNRSVLVIPEEDGYIGCSIRGGSDYGIPVSVVDVDPSSPSQRAGLRPGDIIKNINGYDVKRMAHMQVAYLATSFSELYIDIETRDPGPRKMSLPTGFSQRENMTAYEMNFSPATLPRRRHCSGPHVVGFATPPMTFPRKRSGHRGGSVDRSGFEQDIPDSSVLEAELNRLVSSSVPIFNSDSTMKLSTETMKVTKLISRTIRLNLNVATRNIDVQASPKSMKRCMKTDVRDMFKERLGSPRSSPTFTRHLRRGSDLSRSLGPFSPGLGADFKDSKSDTRSIRSGRSGSGVASVSNCAWNIPPINWTGHVT